MKSICAEVSSIWKSGPGEHWVIIKLDDERVKASELSHISFQASDVLGFDGLKDGDHLTITIRKVEK